MLYSCTCSVFSYYDELAVISCCLFQDPWALRLLIVQESVYPSIKAKITARIKSLKTGGAFEKMADVSDSVIDSTIGKRLQEILKFDLASDVSWVLIFLLNCFRLYITFFVTFFCN